jgi:hypothetical protein
MKEATEVVAEQPKKTKTGTRADAAPKQEKPKASRVAKVTGTETYRILDGVDATKFRGQRQIVVKALQGLGDGAFSIDQIAAKCDGLVSKTPVEASVKYHLNGMITDGQVTKTLVPPAEPEVSQEAAA